MAQSSHTSLALVALAVGIYFLKQYINGPICTSQARLDGKVAIITGANTGVGKQSAEDFVRREEKQLDILMNNAGIMFADGHTTVDGYEETFQVNHLGHFLLTKLLLEMLKATPKSRIVNISAKAHRYGYINFEDIMAEKGYNHLFAYAQSKLANILFTKELAKRLKGTGVTTYAVHPGVVVTDLGRNILIFKYAPLRFLGRVFTWPFLKEAWYGAQSQICCAVSEDMGQETGKYYADCKEKEPSEEAKDMETARKLWDLSEKLIKSRQENLSP